MIKSDFRLCENKGADQLCSNCTADQCLCFRYTDSTMPTLLISKILKFYLLWMYRSDCVGPGRKPRRPVFSHCSTNGINLSGEF